MNREYRSLQLNANVPAGEAAYRFCARRFKTIHRDVAPRKASDLLATFPEIKVRTLNGLETPLFLLLFVATPAFISWRVSSAHPSRLGPWAAVVTGGLLAATFLTRLDSFLLSMVLAVYVLFGPREARLVDRLRFLALVAATEAALVSPYLIRNEVRFGHLMPLSGVVKGWYLAQVAPDLWSYLTSTEWLGPIQLFEEVLFGADVIANHGLLFAALVVFCVTVVAAAVWSIRNGSAFAKLWLGYAAAHLLFFVLIHRENREHTNYYFAIEAIGTAALVVLWVSRQIERSVVGGRAVWGLATLMVCFGLARALGPVQQESSGLRASRYAAALWARENLPPGAVVGSFWAGTFSFVSQDRVVDLVGLCNSRQFFERYLSRDRVAEYILGRHIGYLGGQFDFLSVSPDGTLTVGQAHRLTWGELSELHALARLAPRLRVVRQFGNDFFLLEIQDEARGAARTHKT